MPKATLIGDIGTEHDSFHPSRVITASATVKIDGKAVACVGDLLAPHSNPNGATHCRQIATGSPSVFIDGKPVARDGDQVNCGGVLIATSSINID